MERYTFQQRIEIVKIHYKNGEDFAKTVRKVRSFFGRRGAPSWPAIVKLVRKFELLGQVSDVKSRTRARRANTNEYCFCSSMNLIFLQMKLERLLRRMDCAIKP